MERNNLALTIEELIAQHDYYKQNRDYIEALSRKPQGRFEFMEDIDCDE